MATLLRSDHGVERERMFDLRRVSGRCSQARVIQLPVIRSGVWEPARPGREVGVIELRISRSATKENCQVGDSIRVRLEAATLRPGHESVPGLWSPRSGGSAGTPVRRGGRDPVR